MKGYVDSKVSYESVAVFSQSVCPAVGPGAEHHLVCYKQMT